MTASFRTTCSDLYHQTRWASRANSLLSNDLAATTGWNASCETGDSQSCFNPYGGQAMRHSLRLVHLLVPLAAVACGDSIAGPDGGAALLHEISLGDLGAALETAPARVEIKLEQGTLVAREVELKTADEMSDRESVRGRVSAVSVAADAGTLTFTLGGLEVGFSASARFRGMDGDDVTMAEFAAQVQDALDAGNEPAVRVKRAPPAEPQAPDDAAFTATDLRLLDGLESAKLELNVDADNFALNDTPPPDAWVLVLGLEIEIRSTTEIEADDHDGDESEVEGIVASVDEAAGAVTLTSGAVILIADGTRFEDEEGDDDDGEHLTSLAAVAEALAAGLTVKAEAEGAIESTDPLTVMAREVEFEVEDEGDDDGDDNGGGEIRGLVASVDLDAGSVTLEDGRVILVDDETVFENGDDGDDEHLTSLEDVAQALADGKTVKAEAEGTVQGEEPPTILAREVEFAIES